MKRFGRMVGVAVASMAIAACGGGGGGGGGRAILEDLNGDGTILVVAFGNSITSGTGDGSSRAGYPPRLAALAGVPVVKAGNPGERTVNGVRRLGSVLSANPADVVIILEGVNDLIHGGARDRILSDLQNMVNTVFEAGAIPVLGTLTPAFGEHGFVSGAVRGLNFAIRDTAVANGIEVIDFEAAFGIPFDSTSGLIGSDGLHPSPAGYDLMAEEAANTLLGTGPKRKVAPPTA